MTKASHIVEQAAEAGGVQPARPEWANARRFVVQDRLEPAGRSASGELKSRLARDAGRRHCRPRQGGQGDDRVRRGPSRSAGTCWASPRAVWSSKESQAAAAVGQISLAGAYQAVFKARGLAAAQILLTLGDTEERRRYLNAARPWTPCWPSAPYRWSTRTTRWRPPRSATATTTASRPASPA